MRLNHTARVGLAGLLVGAVLAAAVALPSCGDDSATPFSSARMVASRTDLVGGNRALGDIGDYLLENDQVRLVIQAPGYSRGFGVYGGSLIDADLRRPTEPGFATMDEGNDSFSELFPSFFLEAVATDQVEIVSDGSDGGPAIVRASGFGGDFLTLVGLLNRAATGSHTDYQNADSDPALRYENDFILEPGKRYVTIRFRVRNLTDRTVTFPGSDATTLLRLLGLDLEGFTLPLGDISLFGDTSAPFVPGAGFDLRRSLDRAFAAGAEWPAFPGVVTDWVATAGTIADVSYGYLAEASDRNFVWHKRELYGADGTPVTRSSLLIPFTSASMMGIFQSDAPSELGPGESFETTRYFIVGSGDVGSILDVINELQGTPVGRFGGRVIDGFSGQPTDDVSVLVYQRLENGEHRIYSQYQARPGGHFGGTLAPDSYSARVQGDGRLLSSFVDFEVREGQQTGLSLAANPVGRVVATVVDEQGRLLPAKVMVIGTYGASDAGRDPRDFLFNLSAGEAFRWTDLVEDQADDPSTCRYVEAFDPTQDGQVELLVRPGTYEVFISRGPEYDVVRRTVDVQPGRSASISATLHRVVDTRGWVSGDMHVHGQHSIDSGKPLDRLVRWAAAEGLEWLVGTDHNYLTDYTPVIARNDLTPWITSSVGMELTTLEAGHFNGYPLRYDTGAITHGSFEWSARPPQEIFDTLRSLGAYGPEETMVQVNHPRDTIQGYFESYLRDGLSAEYVAPNLFQSFISQSGPAFYDESGDTTFSYDFEALEVLTGKRLDLAHHYRVPEVLPEGDIPEDVPAAGTILLDSDGAVAFPGAIDDWYNLLNLGYRFIAVGNSDSHEDEEEIGCPRNMIYVGQDDPQALSERGMVAALRSRRVFTTTAPMIDFWIGDPATGEMGSTVHDTDGDGQVSLGLRLTAAPWVSVSGVNIVRNGVIVDRVDVDPDRDLTASPVEETRTIALATDESGTPIDSWFVLEVFGERSLFPMVLPLEVPPLLLSDAVASLGGAFGFGGEEFGDLRPPTTFPVVAFALTNPVWVTTDGEFTPPGVVPWALRRGGDQAPFDLAPGRRLLPGEPGPEAPVRWVGTATPVREPRVPLFTRDRGNPYDVRRIFDAFSHH